MNTPANRLRKSKNISVAHELSKNHSGNNSTFQLKDNRPTTVAQRKLLEIANTSSIVKQATPLGSMTNSYAVQFQNPVQNKHNKTGLPDSLKSGIEHLSGYAMDDVKVHYNSDKPAQLRAHAYAQGTDIHLASGQEKHLPHEAWHVVQQKQGRVKPTMQLKGGVHINDNKGLENEADEQSIKALSLDGKRDHNQINLPFKNTNAIDDSSTLQAKFWEVDDAGNYTWHEEDPDLTLFVDANKKYGRTEDWFSWPVFFAANSLRGRLKSGMDNNNVIEGAPGLGNLEKACWNWALTGFTDDGVYPQKILDYLRMPGQIEELRAQGFDVPNNFDANTWILNNLTIQQGQTWFQNNRMNLDQIWAEYETEISKWYKRTDTVNFATVERLVHQLVSANGFTIVNDSPYQICMHYKKADGITFDHWWIKVDDTVIETFPGRQLPDNSFEGVRDIQIVKTEQDHVSNDGQVMGVVRVNVQSLKPVQTNHIQAALHALGI